MQSTRSYGDARVAWRCADARCCVQAPCQSRGTAGRQCALRLGAAAPRSAAACVAYQQLPARSRGLSWHMCVWLPAAGIYTPGSGLLSVVMSWSGAGGPPLGWKPLLQTRVFVSMPLQLSACLSAVRQGWSVSTWDGAGARATQAMCAALAVAEYLYLVLALNATALPEVRTGHGRSSRRQSCSRGKLCGQLQRAASGRSQQQQHRGSRCTGRLQGRATRAVKGHTWTARLLKWPLVRCLPAPPQEALWLIRHAKFLTLPRVWRLRAADVSRC